MATGGDPGKKRRIGSAPMGNVGSSEQPIVWTDEEDNIIREGLKLYRNYDYKKTYKKIAASLLGKSPKDVQQRAECMMESGTHKITEPATSNPPPISQKKDDDAEVRGNLLDSTKAILEKVGENPQPGNDNRELLFRALQNIVKLMEYYWINDA